MEIEIVTRLYGGKANMRRELLARNGLTDDPQTEQTVLLWDNTELVATGSRQGNLLKCLAVDETRQGEGLTATLLTELRREAFACGYRHLFLYTKPKNRVLFSSLFFYPVAQTDDVLLMENKQNGIQSFLNDLALPSHESGAGAIVMNCDPFTLGHRYLIENAARECPHLYIFVLSEDKGRFSAADRLQMVRNGTADLPNVTVFPTGPYLISSATFPTYFLKDQGAAGEIQCRLDIEIFAAYYAPHFGITRRYVGEEPLCAVTRQYNAALKEYLPLDVVEVPRLEKGNAPVSAGAVRRLLDSGDIESACTLVPHTTTAFFRTEE